MIGPTLLLLAVYAATVAVRRLEEMGRAGAELERRAQGARRPFVLLD